MSKSKDNEGVEKNKARVRWTPDRHQKFLEAIGRIKKRKSPYHSFRFIDGAEDVQIVPKEILEEMRAMGETGLTRQNISSHLQKYRSNPIEQDETSKQQNRHPNPSYSNPGQFYHLPVESSMTAPAAAPYLAPHHLHLCSRNNFCGDYAAPQPGRYFSGIGQHVVVGRPLSAPPRATQQTVMLPHTFSTSPSFSTLGLQQANVEGAALANLQSKFRQPTPIFGNQNQPTFPGTSHSVNYSTTSTIVSPAHATSHLEFIGAAPNPYHYPRLDQTHQNADVGSGTMTADHQDASFNVQNFTVPTSLDEVLQDGRQHGFEGLDLSWLDDWNRTA